MSPGWDVQLRLRNFLLKHQASVAAVGKTAESGAMLLPGAVLVKGSGLIELWKTPKVAYRFLQLTRRDL
jgi:hypothetical protein